MQKIARRFVIQGLTLMLLRVVTKLDARQLNCGYAQASSVANASTARVLSILDSPLQGEEQAIALAADLCAHLERPVLLRLAQLLVQSYESLESKKLNSAIDPQSIREPKMKDTQRRELELKPSSPIT